MNPTKNYYVIVILLNSIEEKTYDWVRQSPFDRTVILVVVK